MQKLKRTRQFLYQSLYYHSMSVICPDFPRLSASSPEHYPDLYLNQSILHTNVLIELICEELRVQILVMLASGYVKQECSIATGQVHLTP